MRVRGAGRGRRRMAGLAVAALMHLALLAAFALQRAPLAPGVALSGGEPGLSITLIRTADRDRQSQTAQAQQAWLEHLRVQLDPPPVAAAPNEPKAPAHNAAELLAAFEQSKTLAGARQGAPKAASPDPQVVADNPWQHAAIQRQTKPDRPDAALWTRLSRCWRSAKTFPDVTLVVALDAAGNLMDTPTVVRSASDKEDRNRYEAEAEAVRAAIACAPYPAAQNQARSLQLEFALARDQGN